MRQKTINLRNQGSFDKKIDFFSQTLSHIPRRVSLEQKNASEKFSRLGTFKEAIVKQSLYGMTAEIMLKHFTDF